MTRQLIPRAADSSAYVSGDPSCTATELPASKFQKQQDQAVAAEPSSKRTPSDVVPAAEPMPIPMSPA
jgi:tRNA A37 threonylcarbamoyladenosine synthetase subunit TsaC/SUA5/YrdC